MTSLPAARCVATFHATYAVLKAEQLLQARGVSVKLIPVPRQISSNCGIAARRPASQRNSPKATR